MKKIPKYIDENVIRKYIDNPINKSLTDFCIKELIKIKKREKSLDTKRRK